MSKLHYLAASGAALVLATSLSTAAFAWHPKGDIKKYVENVTAKTAKQDANSVAAAVSAKPGDILKYTIVVKNVAAPAGNQYNDLKFIKVTDNLPAGVELVSGTASKDYGNTVVVPGKSVSYEFTVKVVTGAKDGQVIDNKACYEGDSVVKDNKQKGCDNAVVKVNVPKTPKPEEPKPETPKEETPEVLPAEIPSTGAGSILASVTGLSAATFAAASFVQSRRK